MEKLFSVTGYLVTDWLRKYFIRAFLDHSLILQRDGWIIPAKTNSYLLYPHHKM